MAYLQMNFFSLFYGLISWLLSVLGEWWEVNIGLDNSLVSSQATNYYYLGRCWPRFLSPYGVTRPQWVTAVIITMFLPEASFGLRVLSLPASVCVYVCVCGNHLLVRTITCHPFKLESPNLDQKSKTPWLRSLLFWGLIDLELQGQI